MKLNHAVCAIIHFRSSIIIDLKEKYLHHQMELLEIIQLFIVNIIVLAYVIITNNFKCLLDKLVWGQIPLKRLNILNNILQ